MRKSALGLIGLLLALLVAGASTASPGNAAPVPMGLSPNPAFISKASLSLGTLAGISRTGIPPTNGASGSPDSVDCSQIQRFGIDKQMNMRAAQILIHCGYI